MTGIIMLGIVATFLLIIGLSPYNGPSPGERRFLEQLEIDPDAPQEWAWKKYPGLLRKLGYKH